MFIQYGYKISISCQQPTPVLTRLDVHPDSMNRVFEASAFSTSPETPVFEFIDSFGNRARRFVAPAGELTMWSSGLIHDNGLREPVMPGAYETPVQNLPAEVLPFLVASRYCDTDLLGQTAWQMFGQTQPGWARVQAVCDYVHNRIRFDYSQARDTRTASDANNEQVGVCRDFAHLSIALCRCLNIPARYVNGYLGDIGVPYNPSPMDFSAWFEAYIGGQWFTFDARHNEPRIGRIVIARGRDAIDVPMIHTFGQHQLCSFEVVTAKLFSPAKEQLLSWFSVHRFAHSAALLERCAASAASPAQLTDPANRR
jgi:transglutaminase-like putative cysteine protease